MQACTKPGGIAASATRGHVTCKSAVNSSSVKCNATTILPVNVRNSTLSSQLPLQLVVGNERDGVRGGSWRWQGTQLIYEQGKATNQGAYYSCQDTNGLMGLFLFTKP